MWEDEDEGSFEVVEDLAFDEIVDEGAQAADGFAKLVALLEDVALASGADPVALRAVRALVGLERLESLSLSGATVEALVAGGLARETDEGLARAESFAREVQAWRGVLCGECEDMSECGPLGLDEWCANVVSRAMGDAARSSGARKQLRQRGVAAFGLMEAA
jgi:hypothetical protein